MGIQAEAEGVTVGGLWRNFCRRWALYVHGPEVFPYPELVLVFGKQGMNWVWGAGPRAPGGGTAE